MLKFCWLTNPFGVKCASSIIKISAIIRKACAKQWTESLGLMHSTALTLSTLSGVLTFRCGPSGFIGTRLSNARNWRNYTRFGIAPYRPTFRFWRNKRWGAMRELPFLVYAAYTNTRCSTHKHSTLTEMTCCHEGMDGYLTFPRLSLFEKVTSNKGTLLCVTLYNTLFKEIIGNLQVNHFSTLSIVKDTTIERVNRTFK